MLDPAEAGFNNIPKTARLVTAAQLPRLSLPIGDPWLFARTRLHWGLIIAMVLAVIIYIFLWRTSWGYRIRAVGENQRASSYAGINVKRQMMFSMFLAGGFSLGLAGVVQVLGLQYRLQTDGSPAGFTGAAGFNGIVAALFGGLNPIGAIPAAAFFGGLLVGAQKMQRELGVPASLITAVNGLIVVFVVSSEIFILQRSKRRVSVVIENESPTGGPTKKKGLASDQARRWGRGRLMGLDDILTASVFASAIRLATPYIFAALGETFAQRSGVLNLGVDGMMLMGAFTGFYAVYVAQTNAAMSEPMSLLFGVAVALIVGGLMGLAMAFVSVTLKAKQGISGIGVYLFGLGLSELLFQQWVGTPKSVSGFPRINFPVLTDLPIVGEIFFPSQFAGLCGFRAGADLGLCTQ